MEKWLLDCAKAARAYLYPGQESGEWVDIPSWIGDYYLAAQVEPDEGWVRIWGYCTHQQLKTRGSYDAGDRSPFRIPYQLPYTSADEQRKSQPLTRV